MSLPPSSFPAFEQGLCLHLRLGEGDATAPPYVCQAYLVPLLAWLESIYPLVDSHLRQEAIHETLFDYVKHPEKYDPSKSDLAVYLRMAASCDLRNALQREKRHHRKQIAWKNVELGEEAGNLSGRESEPVVHLQQQEEAAEWHAFLDAMRAGLTQAEQIVLQLMLEGERKTRAFAEVLGLLELPTGEQQREVKRVKDRLKKRLERGGKRDG